MFESGVNKATISLIVTLLSGSLAFGQAPQLRRSVVGEEPVWTISHINGSGRRKPDLRGYDAYCCLSSFAASVRRNISGTVGQYFYRSLVTEFIIFRVFLNLNFFKLYRGNHE